MHQSAVPRCSPAWPVAGSSCRAGVSGSEDDEEREERERLGAMGQVGAEQTDVPKRRGGRCGERLDADVVPRNSHLRPNTILLTSRTWSSSWHSFTQLRNSASHADCGRCESQNMPRVAFMNAND